MTEKYGRAEFKREIKELSTTYGFDANDAATFFRDYIADKRHGVKTIQQEEKYLIRVVKKVRELFEQEAEMTEANPRYQRKGLDYTAREGIANWCCKQSAYFRPSERDLCNQPFITVESIDDCLPRSEEEDD
ncbi:MAG: hypothetical protein AABX04_02375 [Nanoarchaeota archaeon]